MHTYTCNIRQFIKSWLPQDYILNTLVSDAPRGGVGGRWRTITSTLRNSLLQYLFALLYMGSHSHVWLAAVTLKGSKIKGQKSIPVRTTELQW